MSRARKSGKGLPRRVYKKHGAYYFFSSVPLKDPSDERMKKWIRLASIVEGESVMYKALAAIFDNKKVMAGSMRFCCDEYRDNKLAKYSPETQTQYTQYLKSIADCFEDFHVTQVTTKDCAVFLRDNFKDKPNTARKYSALMRRLFKFIISELGLRQDNPVDQLDLSDYETSRREILPTHDQVQRIRDAGMTSKEHKDTGNTFATASGPMFGCLIDISYLLWQRMIDVRTLKESQIEDGIGGRIRFKPSKTSKTSGKTVDIVITPQIHEVLERARKIKKEYRIKGQPLITPYLFPTRDGEPYTKSGLFSMWDRARERAGITDAVWFKDLRALGATDAAKAGTDKRAIQTRLAHTSGKTSDIYIKESVPELSAIDLPLPWLK